MAKGDSIKEGVPYKPADSTTLTTMQEQATLAIIEYVFEKRSKKLALSDFGKVTNGKITDINEVGNWRSYNDVQKIIFKKFPVKYMNNWNWINSFYKQQDLFFGLTFGGHTVTASDSTTYSHYSQSDKSGFMNYISDLVREKYGISRKDTWNPADIWLVWNYRNAKQRINAAVKGHKEIKVLNDLLREMLYKHEIVGISLKMISKKDARWEVVNLMGPDFQEVFSTTGKDSYKYQALKNYKSRPGIVLPLDIKTGYHTGMDGWKRDLAQLAQENPKLFSDGVAHSWGDLGSALVVGYDDEVYQIDIKADHTSKTGGSDLKFEPKEVSGKARLGRADKPRVLKLLGSLSGVPGAENFNHWAQYPRTLAKWEREKGTFIRMVNQIIKTSPDWPIGVNSKNADIKVSSGEDFANNVTTLFKEVENLAKEEPDVLNKKGEVVGGYEAGPGIDKPIFYSEDYYDPDVVDVKTIDWGTNYRNARLTSFRLRFNVVAKLMQVQCYYYLKKMSEKVDDPATGETRLDKWITLVMYMAQKKGAGFGPFGKIY